MTWHYVTIRKTRNVKGKIVHWYDIHEVFKHGKEVSWTTEPVYVGHEFLDDTRNALATMLADSYRFPVVEIRKGKLVSRKGDIWKCKRMR